MTNPVQPTGAIPAAPTQTPKAPAPAPVRAPAAFTVEVSRAATAPVYVYRLTDTATGRVLVEIPNDPPAPAPDGPGGKLDAKV